MAEVRPFNGILYDAAAGDIAELITPPYDVISADAQRAYHEKNQHNIVHIDFGLETEGDDKYERAGRLLGEWLRSGVLIRDDEPALYVLEQAYELEDGTRKARTGFIGAVRLEGFGTGKVLPHERTLSKPRADRLQLLRATRANLSQVFALFGDPTGTVDRALSTAKDSEPLLEVVDYQSVVNRLWRLADPVRIGAVAGAMADKALFIADGHHRYETSLAYRDEMRRASGDSAGESPFDYVMMMLVNMDTQEMTILPTHRLVRGLPQRFMDDFLEKAEQFFEIRDVDRATTPQVVREMQQLQPECHELAFLAADGPLRLLRLRHPDVMEAIVPADQSDALRLLDVTVLHSLVFDHILEIDAEIALLRSDIVFEKSVSECMRLVDDGVYQGAFFLRATQIGQMREIAAREERMPQKSTFFYPKLPTGLVLNRVG